MSKKVYDFGVELLDTTPETRKMLVWPVSVWRCYIPENINKNIDILEKLVLSLARMKVTDFHSILTSQLGFAADLVKVVINNCKDKKYLHKTYHTILKAGEEALSSYENPYQTDMEISKNSKKVYLIQDLVTGNVIPCFDKDILPVSYEEVDDCISIHYNQSEMKRPNIASINNAIKHWNRINRFSTTSDKLGTGNINFNDLGKEEDNEFLLFEDEVDWREIGEEDAISKDSSHVSIESSKSSNITAKEYYDITIYDDKSEIYFLKAFVAINSSSPDEIIVLSPLGEKLNYWFRTIFNRVYASDENFKMDIDLFIDEKTESLKDKLAFNNNLYVELFEKFPLLCNDKKYKDMKTCIENVVRAKNRIESGEEDFYSFGTSIRTAVDRIFKEVYKTIVRVQSIKEKVPDYNTYKKAVKDLVFTYKLNSEIERRYCNLDIYSNMRRGSGNAKDTAAMLLMEAYFYKDSNSMILLKDMPEIFIRIFTLAGDGNDFIHANDGFSSKTYSTEEVKETYVMLEGIIIALYTHYLRGE